MYLPVGMENQFFLLQIEDMLCVMLGSRNISDFKKFFFLILKYFHQLNANNLKDQNLECSRIPKVLSISMLSILEIFRFGIFMLNLWQRKIKCKGTLLHCTQLLLMSLESFLYP